MSRATGESKEEKVVVEVPKDDEREYRYFVLKNGMKCVIYNDPEGDREGAALCVRVGSSKDPKELPGLARFLEHMLFKGTKQFPRENEYSEYISTHGGKNNGYTAAEETNFYFDIAKGGHLPHALKIFSSFFKDPLFKESSNEKELKAIDSENAKNYQNDYWKKHQLLKSLADPKHPFNGFNTGNMKTLHDIPKEKGINVRQALVDFYTKYYSANIMTLAVAIANSDLDVYERIVREEFEAIVNKSVPIDIGVIRGSPWSSAHLSRHVSWVPVNDRHKFTIIWVIPGIRDLYMYKPCLVIGHTIGHEGEGSVFTHLRSKGWCHTLYAGVGYSSQDWALFNINLHLTDEGLKHRDEIVDFCYQYIEEIKEGLKNGKIRQLSEEAANIKLQKFEYQKKNNPYKMVNTLASGLHHYKPEHILNGGWLIFKQDMDLVSKYVNCLTPDNCLLMTASKLFEDDCKLEEPWYSTKYKIEPASLPKTQSNDCKDIRLPKINEFIATDLSVLIPKDKAPKEEDKAIPKLIKKSEFMDVWHKTDDRFHKPKVYARFKYYFANPQSTPRRQELGNIWRRYLKFLMNEYAYDASVAGLSFNTFMTSSGLEIVFSGFNQKLQVLLRAVLTKITECTKLFTDERFEIIRKKLEQDYKNWWNAKPYRIALEAEKQLSEFNHHTVADLEAVSKELTRKKLIEFTDDMLESGFLRAFVHGNITAEEAIQMSEMWCEVLQFKPMSTDLITKSQILQLPLGNFAYQEKLRNLDEPCSSLVALFQVGPVGLNHKLNLIATLYDMCIDECQYDFLRTKKGIGYIAWAFWRRRDEIGVFKHVLQSSTFTCAAIEEILNEFVVEKVSKFLEELSEEDFSKFRDALLKTKLEKFTSLNSESNFHWGQIKRNQFCFNRRQIEAALAPKLTKADVIAFYKKYILPTSKTCRKLSIHVVCKPNEKKPPKEPETKLCEEFLWIKDHKAFVKDLGVYPCLTAYKREADDEKKQE